jgi:RNA polymerase sigma-70 factor (sigma-E family)
MMQTSAHGLPRGRDGAVSALFIAHHARLVGLARLIVDDLPTAEDVVQDAFASLYRRWPWLRDKPAALFYLEAAVANGAKSNLRRRRTVRLARLEGPVVIPSAESTVVASVDNQALRLALTRLPLRQRQVIVLRYYLGWSETEIAERLAISRGSVKQHASRAMSTLSAQLEAAR